MTFEGLGEMLKVTLHTWSKNLLGLEGHCGHSFQFRVDLIVFPGKVQIVHELEFLGDFQARYLKKKMKSTQLWPQLSPRYLITNLYTMMQQMT